MSYIDGYFDRNSDIIRVVERQNKERIFKEYPRNIHGIPKEYLRNI